MREDRAALNAAAKVTDAGADDVRCFLPKRLPTPNKGQSLLSTAPQERLLRVMEAHEQASRDALACAHSALRRCRLPLHGAGEAGSTRIALALNAADADREPGGNTVRRSRSGIWQ
jgi:hypothetical protein